VEDGIRSKLDIKFFITHLCQLWLRVVVLVDQIGLEPRVSIRLKKDLRPTLTSVQKGRNPADSRVSHQVKNWAKVFFQI
jgi:hypothetical protein